MDSLLAVDANAKVVVLGDLNDFEFSAPLTTLKGTSLVDLVETLPQADRYSYVYDGNLQVLDHILIITSLNAYSKRYESVHVNAEFATRASDHDPQVMRLTLSAPIYLPLISR